jgi:hypothetical protein
MRPLLALIIVVTILGSLQLYVQHRPAPPVAAELIREQVARGDFSVEITLTFDAGPDAFAIDPATAPSLVLLLRGQEILRRQDTIAAGQPLIVQDVQGLVSGGNEFYLSATPADTQSSLARAARVRILRSGTPLADETLWSEPSETVQGTIVVQIPAWAEP